MTQQIANGSSRRSHFKKSSLIVEYNLLTSWANAERFPGGTRHMGKFEDVKPMLSRAAMSINSFALAVKLSI